MAEMLIQLALSEKPIDNELESRIEEARRYLVGNYQSLSYDGGWGYRTQTLMDCRENGKREGGGHGGASPEVWNNLPDRILAASPHLGTREVPDPYACLNAAGRAFVEPDVDFRVEWARRYLVDGWQSFKYMPGDSWGVSTGQRTTPGADRDNAYCFTTLPSRILAASPHLQQNLDALKKVYLECDDAIKVIDRWATPETLFYLDPPYIDCEAYYSHNAKQGKDYNLELHYRLAEAINNVDCAGAIVSYYPDDLLDELYPEKHWDRHYKETVASSAGITRQSKSKKRPKRTELLLVRKNRNEGTVRVAMSGQLKFL